MAMTDPLGDMLTRIRNAQMRNKSSVVTPASKLRGWVLEVLKDEGYIRDFKSETADSGNKTLKVDLKYYGGEPVIRELKRISKPGRRIYADVKEIPTVRQGLGIAIVSTSKGVMSGSKARSFNVGGEVLCTVF